MSAAGANRDRVMRRLCGLWIAATSCVVPARARDGWTREWRGELDALLHDGEPTDARRVWAYVSGALPDALTLRAYSIADAVHALGGGSHTLLTHPIRAALAVTVMAVPTAIVVVAFQCARATLARRPPDWDVAMLALVAVATLTGLAWSAARMVAHATTSLVTSSWVTSTSVAVPSALVSIPLIKVGLLRLGSTVLRTPGAEPATFYGDVWTVAIWIFVTLGTWRLSVRAIASEAPARARGSVCADDF